MQSSYSPGRLIALWRMIRIVHTNNDDMGYTIQTIASVVNAMGIFEDDSSLNECVNLGRQCKLFNVQSDKLVLTKICRENFADQHDVDEPTLHLLRSLVRHIIIVHRFHWVLFFSNDIEVFRAAIPDNWIEIFSSTHLFELNQLEVQQWWRNVLEDLQQIEDRKRKQAGYKAEELTFQYEKNRLALDGFENSHLLVKWMASVNDELGYDILSKRGRWLKGTYDVSDPICIEVKSSNIRSASAFRFELTKNEWKSALGDPERFYFFCWTGIDANSNSIGNGPFILSAVDLAKYVPVNPLPDVCEWTHCKFILDINLHFMNQST